MALTPKTVFARVSSTSGEFLKTWSNIAFQGYSKTINGGVGECIFHLAERFDYDGAELREGNSVEVLLRDRDTLADPSILGDVQIIYRGYISLIEREMTAGAETITVHLLGYYTLLALDIFRLENFTTLFSDVTDGFIHD